MNQSKQWAENMRKGFVKLAVVALGGVLLAGCDKNTITTIHEHVYSSPKMPAPTSSEQHAKYMAALRDEGVQVIQLGETIRLVMLSDEVFAPNSANIVPAYRPVLTDVARLMATYDITSVKVAAYSDKQSPKNLQTALTTQQAQAVSKFLWSRGVDTRLMYAKGYAGSKPVDSAASASGRNNNRRVEISFQFYPKRAAY